MAGDNPQTTLPPVPREPMISNQGRMSMQWERWIQQVQRILSYAGGIAWGIVNKAGSLLTDIEIRPHSMLQAILGTGDRHITAAENAEITAIDGLAAGMTAKTGNAAYASRTITGTADEVEVANGDGISGNPTISLPDLISTPRKFGTATDYVEVEAAGVGTKAGFVRREGDSRYYVDIDFPILIRTTGVGIPTLQTLNGNITAPQWQVNDFNQCESQEFIHGWDEGTQVNWHCHLTTNGTDVTDRYVRFTVEYGYVTPHGQWVWPAVIDSGDILIPANTPNQTMEILSLGIFTPTGVKIGGHCIAYLKRIAATGIAPTNNPWVPMLQLHVHCDTEGSREIGTK